MVEMRAHTLYYNTVLILNISFNPVFMWKYLMNDSSHVLCYTQFTYKVFLIENEDSTHT